MGTDVSVTRYTDKVDQMSRCKTDPKIVGESSSERRAEHLVQHTYKTSARGGDSVALSADTWNSSFYSGDAESEYGYVLVDLNGDKVLQEDREFLCGCEIFIPGLGVGLTVSYVDESSHARLYRVQMTDGRSMAVSIKRCTAQPSTISNLNPRIFLMQRLR
ncbi:hypothetical protein B484DRAFT_452919 [Ochromonadaceae sp. CCMP2298]|nr:hypothetical protein B484DRAFT_452919 [Ochromonadaceae sp. CCMP2298]